MMKKVIVIDLDGTALADGQTIAPKTLEQLKIAQTNGHEIVIATGRPLNAMAHFAEVIQPTAIVTSNGAVVMRYEAGECRLIEKHSLNGGLFATVMKQHEDEIETTWLEAHKQTFIDHFHPHLDVVFNSHRPMGFEYELQPLGVHEYAKAQVCLLLLKNGQNLSMMIEILQAKLGEAYQMHGFIQAGVPFIEISLATISKATGLTRLNTLFSWNFDQMIAFGDQYNDCEMLQAVGHGVAMLNAPAGIKEVSDAVTTYDNVDGGVGVYLATYL